MPPSPDGYRIMREIHRGGQGVVYLAEQESTCRTVALKVMREGPLASDAERVRFKQEVHVLAALRHPNIVTIHDSGESGGRFYYIMDYIEGLPLDAYVRVNRPAVNDTLRLFVKIADAVNAAHLRGVIHRDLKPPNVLVDCQGRPHVLDFGLAKVLSGDDDSAEGAALTRTGEFVGSLPWASPEQAEGRHDDVDLRTDVYALGVLLYQALTGRFPYPVAGAVRAVLDNIVNAAPRRPRTIRSQIGDEVETIVLKCLAKDRARRYQSAGEVARDLEHYLNGEPIEAKRDSFGYLLRKQLRKHRLLTGFAGALVLFSGSLASSSFFAWTSYLRAERLAAAESAARGQAQRDRKRAETINEFVTNALVSADPNRGGAQGFLVTDAMQRAIALLDGGALHDQPETEAALRLTIAIILDGNARSEQALRLAQRALEIEQVLHPGDHADLAESLNGVALCLHSLGRADEALPKYEAALQMFRRLSDGDHPDVATSLGNAGACLESLGQSAEALAKHEAALEMRQRIFKGDHPDVASSHNNVADCLESLGRSTEALSEYEAALEMRRRLFEHDHPDLATSLDNLAYSLNSLGRSAEALPKFEAALEMTQRLFDGDHPDVANSLNNLAYCLNSLDRSAEALPKFEAALQMTQRLFEGDHPDLAANLSNVGLCLDSLGRSTEALPKFEAALQMKQRLFQGDHPTLAAGLNNLASCLNSLGRSAEALPRYEAALEIFRRVLTPGDPRTLFPQIGLARTLVSLGRYAEAEPLLRDAAEQCERSESIRRRRGQSVLEAMVNLYDAWGKPELADPYRQELRATTSAPADDR